MSALPKEIGSLQKLETLELAFCKLTAVPDSITKLQNLTKLDLQRTAITGE